MSDPLTFVAWRWLSPVGYRSTFAPETVFALREMIRRHYHRPFRFVCVADRPEELKGIETIRIWEDHAAIPSPFGAHNPSCYRRLKVFAPDAGRVFGERLVSIDLDTVIVDDITPLFDTDAEFKIWGERGHDRKLWGDNGSNWYNGSLWLLKTGTRTKVWTEFDAETSPAKTAKAGFRGSDQAWFAYILGKDEQTWGMSDGVYSYRKFIAPRGNVLPPGVKVVSFHGRHDPWSAHCNQVPWIKLHYPKIEAVA